MVYSYYTNVLKKIMNLLGVMYLFLVTYRLRAYFIETNVRGGMYSIRSMQILGNFRVVVYL